MSLEALVVDPVRESLPAGWQRFVREAGLPAIWESDLLLRLAWFVRQPSLMAVVTDGGHPCALFHARHRGVLPPRRFRGTERRLLPGIVECHLAPFATSPGHAFHPDLPPNDQAAAVTAFERAVTRRLGLRCAGIVYRQVTDAHKAAFHGRIIRPGMPDAVIDNRWGSVEEYLRDLPRRDRRYLRRIDRAVGGDSVVRSGVETSIDAAEASRLFTAVQNRYRGRLAAPVPVPPLYFDLLSGRSGISYFTYRRPDGGLLAYSMLVDDGRTLLCHGWGTLDPAEGGRPLLYFDHFLRQVKHLIETGRERMSMGKAMFEVKRRYGARLSPLYAVATFR